MNTTSTLDTIYNDFTTKLLPQIQNGLVITKDYFLDLFGRYVKFLIVEDIFYTVWGIICLVIGIILFKKFLKLTKKDSHIDDGHIAGMIFLGILPIIIGILMISINTLDLIQTIYVPEISVMQAISNFKK